MTLDEYREKQQQLLDNIPSNESRNIILCESCASFVYMQPVSAEGECKGCGATYTEGIRVKNI